MDYPTNMSLRKTTPIYIAVTLIIGLLAGFFIGQTATSGAVVERTVTELRAVTATLTETRVAATTVVRTETATVTAVVEESLVKYAKLFDLRRGEGYFLLRDGVNRTILLVPKGMPVPNVKADVVVRTPVERAVLMSATHVALVERLRELDPEIYSRVDAIMWGRSYEWHFPHVAKLLADGRVKDVGAAWAPDYEQLAAIRPDLVMIYTFPGDPLVSKLEELKLPYVVNNEYLETTLLGRFEYIKFVAVFFGLLDEANKVFRYVESSVQLTSSSCKRLVEANVVKPPKVLWFSVFRGTVYVAGGESYVANALTDLAAQYLFRDIKASGSRTVSVEELVARAVDADIIVISTDLITSAEDLLKEIPQLRESKAFQQSRIYRYNSNIFQLGYYATEDWFRELASVLYPAYFHDSAYDFFVSLR